MNINMIIKRMWFLLCQSSCCHSAVIVLWQICLLNAQAIERQRDNLGRWRGWCASSASDEDNDFDLFAGWLCLMLKNTKFLQLGLLFACESAETRMRETTATKLRQMKNALAWQCCFVATYDAAATTLRRWASGQNRHRAQKRADC